MANERFSTGRGPNSAVLDPIATAAILEKRRQRIGRNLLDSTVRNELGGVTGKEFFTQDDIREITVGKIDMKAAELGKADQDSPATTKAQNDLRDLRAAVVGLDLKPGQSFYGAALERADALREEGGRDDEADIMRTAGEALLDTANIPDKIDWSADDIKGQRYLAIKGAMDEHNAWVVENNHQG